MSTQYSRGVRVERELRDLIESSGLTCMRTAGSKGPFDLIALGRYKTYLIQVKLTSSDNYRVAKRTIRSLEGYTTQTRGVAILSVQANTRKTHLCLLRHSRYPNEEVQNYFVPFRDAADILIRDINSIV